MTKSSHGSVTVDLRWQAKHLHEVSDLFIQYIEQLSVEYVFGIPGGAIEPLYNALARSEWRGGPEAITARHESGAAYMAQGYYNSSGKLGVCCATTGPGATNLITGVSSAYENNIPLLVITAQTSLNLFGKGAFQESSDTSVNTLGMFQYCTKYNSLVSHPDQFERKLYTAVLTALQSRSPAHISMPMDIFRSKTKVTEPTYDLRPLMLANAGFYDKDSVNALCYLLMQRKNIVFVIGDDCINAIGIILSVAFLTKAKLVTTPHGKGLVSPYHPLFRGVIGFSGHRSAEKLLEDDKVDLIVAIGTSLSEWTNCNWDKPDIMRDRLVHVESFSGNFAGSPAAALHVEGDISEIFEKLFEQVLKTTDKTQADVLAIIEKEHSQKNARHFTIDSEQKCTSSSVPIKPQRLMHDLAELFPPQTRWLADVGNSFSWAVHYLHPFDRRVAGRRERGYSLFQACFEFAPMGWAIGTAVGISIAEPNIPVVCITGDGSWLMNGQEVTVALEHNLNVIFIILNDSALGMVKHGQIMSGAERIGSKLPVVNFEALSSALGVEAYTIESAQDLANLDIQAITHKKGPVVLDVRVDPTEAPPMGVRLKALKADN